MIKMILDRNKNQILFSDKELYDLLKKCDLSQKTDNEKTLLEYFLMIIDRENYQIEFSNEQMYHLIKKNIVKLNEYEKNILLIKIFTSNKEKKINLNTKQIEEFLSDANLKIRNRDNWNVLYYLINFNTVQNLNVDAQKIKNYVFEHEWKNIDDYLMYYIMKYNHKSNIHFSIEELKTIFDKVPDNGKEKTFELLMKEEDRFQKNIDILLYECKYQPKEWMFKAFQSLEKRIEKRDIFLNLAHNLNIEENKKKDRHKI